MSASRRPLLVGALTAAIVALVAPAAVAVGVIGGGRFTEVCGVMA